MLILLVAAAMVSTSLTGVRDAYPMLSPNGRTIVFQSNRSGSQALWLTDADGRNPRPLFDHLGGDPATPAWSPDGRWVAFAMRPDGASNPDESDIFLVASDGSGLRRLTSEPGDDSHPHWSAHSGRIFFNSPRATPDPHVAWSKQQFGIYSMAPDGSDVRLHIACDGVCTYPTPSPDGRRIAFRKVLREPGRDWDQQKITGNSEVFVANLDGSQQRNLTRNAAFDGWPAWSLDSQTVFFSSNRDGEQSVGQIYKVPAAGGAIEQITSPDGWSRAQPSASPDGSILVYELKEDKHAEIGHIARLTAGSH